MPKDNEFLREFFVDCQNAMRWRSEIEYKLLNMVIILNPIIVTAILGINEIVSDEKIFLVLTFSMAIFLTVLTILLTLKIKAEHKTYEVIGQQVVKIWKYFKLFEKGAYIDDDKILDKESENYGKGRGYLRTLCILWAMTIMTDTILIVIGIIKYVAQTK